MNLTHGWAEFLWIFSTSVLSYLKVGLEKRHDSLSRGIMMEQEVKQESDLLVLGKLVKKHVWVGRVEPSWKNWEYIVTVGQMIAKIKFIKDGKQFFVGKKRRICLYRCSVKIHQCQILYLQVQMHNYIHTTLGCLFKPCMCLSLFQGELCQTVGSSAFFLGSFFYGTLFWYYSV